ncbi:MAG: helix-turn-helix domain-containing protein [Gammaproteobacteria bacterium]|nr:helix-turn-helix domain-containing protein [Gammaproteobacteria bacterium]
MEKRYFTEKEASEIYGYSLHWWRRMRWAGEGPRYIKMKHRVFYPVEELENYFHSFKLCQSTSDYQESSG